MRERSGVVGVAILLALAVAGLRAHGTFSRTPNAAAAGASGTVLAIALAVAEGAGLVAVIGILVLARPKRPNKDDEPELVDLKIPWWVKTTGVLVAAALLVMPFVVLVVTRTHKKVVPPVAAHGGVRAPSGANRLVAPGTGSLWPFVAGLAIALVAVVIVVILNRRRRTAGTPRPARPNGLLSALAAGQDALAAEQDPRHAIITCYAAMERGFAAAGSAPAAADTPAEVLGRAVSAGILRSPAGEALTSLFRRARYSTEPMAAADRDAAMAALARLRADLEEPDLQGAQLEGAAP